jgi:hypothetical protein
MGATGARKVTAPSGKRAHRSGGPVPLGHRDPVCAASACTHWPSLNTRPRRRFVRSPATPRSRWADGHLLAAERLRRDRNFVGRRPCREREHPRVHGLRYPPTLQPVQPRLAFRRVEIPVLDPVRRSPSPQTTKSAGDTAWRDIRLPREPGGSPYRLIDGHPDTAPRRLLVGRRVEALSAPRR